MAAEFDTVIKNISGSAKTFAFLGPHGKRLAANETLTVAGNLVTHLASLRSPRKYNALQAALTDELLTILSVPSPVMLDPEDTTPRTLQVDDRVLGTVTPSWV